MDIHSARSGSWWRAQAQQHVRRVEGGTHATPSVPGASAIGNEPCDVVIIGAGITGLSLAVMLAERGRGVTVLEASTVGGGATGGSTAKVSLLQGSRLSAVRTKHGDDVLRSYVAANRAGQEWLIDRLRGRSDVQQTTAVSYVQDADAAGLVEDELAAASAAGLDAYLMHSPDVPFMFHRGVALDGQWQIDPMGALGVLADRCRELGVRIVEGCRVTGLERSSMTLSTSGGEVTGQTIVCAAGAPLFDRAGLFARLEVQRSYAAMLRWDGPVPDGMFLSLDEPSRSYRFGLEGDKRVVLIGGNGHQVGAGGSEHDHVAEMLAWGTSVFPGAEPVRWWAAQDYLPTKALPFVGGLTPGDDQVFVATGFAKWGMTNGVAAALKLTGDITGDQVEWASAVDSWSSHEVKSVGSTARLTAHVTHDLVKDRLAALRSLDETPPLEGDGRVGRRGLHSVAESTVDGCTRAVSAACTHLGGIVQWNDAEKTWDCPLHGSRFAADGTRLEGPAVDDLSER